MSETIPSPQEFFGHEMGADRRLAPWDRIVEYFWLLDQSPKVKVEELGKSTEGNPFLLAVITSERNMGRLEELREISWRLAHPRGASREEIENLVERGAAVVAMTMSIHATEVGGTQMAPELAWELATQPQYEEVLEKVVLLLFPCFNPDGQLMVVDFYEKYLGTEYEGCSPPWLYHKYCGHDNNRDAIHNNMVESQMVSRVLYREWSPQAYIDYHHMGSYGARFYIPPFANPVDDKVDPLVWTEQELYGGLTHVLLEAEGKTGVESNATYPGEFMPTFNYVPCWHNICGMLTESASAKLATPIYIHRHQLRPSRRGRPEYRTQMGFPHPWPGGWWRLRDIVEQQKISALATLRAAAAFKQQVLWNMYLKASNSIKKGLEEPPYAFVFKPDQHDPLTMLKLVRKLVEMGVEVKRSLKGFRAGGVDYPRGTYLVLASQHCRPYVVSLLKRTFYHLGPHSFRPDGTPITPYDLSTYTVAEFMGVRVHEVSKAFEGSFEDVAQVRLPRGRVSEAGEGGWLLDCRPNASFEAANRLLRKGVQVGRLREPLGELPAGSFHIPQAAGVEEELRRVARRCHVSFQPAPRGVESRPTRLLNIGVYQRYYGGNTDEGWTRWLLEQYRYRYRTVRDQQVLRSRLDRFDALVLPSDAKEFLLGEGLEDYFERRWGGGFTMPNYPEEYRSGFGQKGVERLKAYVEGGGTLICLGESSNFAIEELGLPIENVLKDLNPKEFTCPGSTLHVEVNKSHPLAWGVQEDLLVVFRNHPAFAVKPRVNNEDYQVVLSYPERHIMESGWLTGEKYLAGKAALVEAKMGGGRVVLYGFQPQMRAQTDATFKLFFNALTPPAMGETEWVL